MASQHRGEPARGKESGGEGEEEEGVAERNQGGSGEAVVPEQSEAVDTSRRIGPWHPPDYQRQRVLADRLSNPGLRTSRPGTTTSDSSSQQQQESSKQQQHRHRTPSPFLQHSPYYHHPSERRAVTADARNPRMNNNRASSGNPSSSSPRHNHPSSSSPRRPQTSSATPHYGAVSPRRQPPLFPTPATSRRVTEDELDGIVERVTKPTVSSRGGVDLRDKDFTYIPTPRLKTLPVVPGLDRRYLGLQKVDSARMEKIVGRLTRMTSAYKAKFAPNGNVYVDREPGAHMVPQRSARSAV